MARDHKDAVWVLERGADPGTVANTQEAILSVLMDIRDELKLLNLATPQLRCPIAKLHDEKTNG